jgi:tetratricopeptide (TPR) repeat protein
MEVRAEGERSVAAHTISGTVVVTGDHATVLAGGVSLRPAAEVAAPAGVANLPRPPSPVFLGRAAALAEVAAALAAAGGGVVGQAVHGLGGVGKTEVALHYAAENRDRYALVWWVSADTPEGIALGLAGLARRLHPAGPLLANLADAADWALAWLQSHAGWLLVLDNVEDPAHIEALAAQLGGGHLLVTSRRAVDWSRLGLRAVRLGVLNRPDSVALLTRRARGASAAEDGERDAADALAADLGDLPLALEQAAAYIAERAISVGEYHRRLAAQPDRLHDAVAEGADQDRAVRRVWDLTMAAIAQRSPAAAGLLGVLSWLGPDQLPEDVLTAGDDADPLEVEDALALLASYSMVSRAAGMVSVHRLVQAITRAGHSGGRGGAGTAAGPSGRDRAVDLIVAAAPGGDPLTEVAGWPRWNALLPHVDALAANIPAAEPAPRLSYLLDRAATHRRGQGQLDQAIALFERALADRERVRGPDHPATLATRNNLGLAYRDAGRLDQAIALHERTLADYERVLGPDHPATLTGRNNLGLAYRAAGRLGQAIALFERTLADAQRTLGPEHPLTVTIRAGLQAARTDS